MRFYLTLFIFLFLFSCSEKHGEATTTKEFEGQKCIISAVSNRDFSIQGIGGSCMVLPIVIPVSDKYFASNVLINDSLNLVLEVSGSFPTLDSIQITEYVNSIELSFADDNFNQFWFYRFQDKMGARSRIIHRLVDRFSFYTEYPKNKKPNWENIETPQNSFLNLLNDSSKSKEQSFLLWNYVNTLAIDSNPYKYISLKFWETDYNAKRFILNYNKRINLSSLDEKRDWNLKIDSLIKTRVKEFSKISNASQQYSDEIEDLLILTLYDDAQRSKPILDLLFKEIFIPVHKASAFWSSDQKSSLSLFNKNSELLNFQEKEYKAATLELINKSGTDSLSLIKLAVLRNISAFKNNSEVQFAIIEKIMKSKNNEEKYVFIEEQYIDKCSGTKNDIALIVASLKNEKNSLDSTAKYIIEVARVHCK